MSDFNSGIIEEFRANAGQVGGPFAGAPMVLVHHVGRKSGTAYVTPLVCLPDAEDADSVFIFASKGGAPSNPAWYHNLVSAGQAEIERGSERYAVRVTELVGDERDAVFAEQVRRMPGFGDYAAKVDGIRVIPVLKLTRS